MKKLFLALIILMASTQSFAANPSEFRFEYDYLTEAELRAQITRNDKAMWHDAYYKGGSRLESMRRESRELQKALRIKRGMGGFATLKHTGRVGLIAGGIAAALTLSGEANANETANRSASNITSDTNVIKIQKTRTVSNGTR